jgi:hypothetical protein
MITSLLVLSSIFCPVQSTTELLRKDSASFEPKKSLHVTMLPLDLPQSFLNEKDQKVFRNLSSKDVNHRFIMHGLQTSTFLPRSQSLQILRDVDLRKKIEKKYGDLLIFPLTLTFQQDDMAVLKRSDVFSFIRRVQTVVFEGTQRLVIEAKHSAADVLHGWDIERYDPKSWASIHSLLNHPISVQEVLELATVTGVKKLDLFTNVAALGIELSLPFTEGNMNWTVTTSACLSLSKFLREDNTVKQILLNDKLRNLQTLRLVSELHRSVLDEVSVLANLTKLHVSGMKVVDCSALENLTNLKELILEKTKVENISALTKLTKLESLKFSGSKIDNISALETMTNLKVMCLTEMKVSIYQVLSLKKKLPKLVVITQMLW